MTREGYESGKNLSKRDPVTPEGTGNSTSGDPLYQIFGAFKFHDGSVGVWQWEGGNGAIWAIGC